jgi:hypothetical protein
MLPQCDIPVKRPENRDFSALFEGFFRKITRFERFFGFPIRFRTGGQRTGRNCAVIAGAWWLHRVCGKALARQHIFERGDSYG